MVRKLAVLALGASMVLVACKKKDEEAATEEPATEEPATEEPTTEEPAPDADAELLARGEYVVQLTGCPLCHTPFMEGQPAPDMSKAWAGGLEIPEKFGTWRSPNITQDKATGIGDWTDEQIIKGVREGVRPDGSRMYPLMPYMLYNAMSDDDARALVAVLRKIEPIENKVEPNDGLKLPKPEVPPATGDAPDPANEIERGKYLASLMHCVMCHTPADDSGMPMMEKAFAGGFEFELPMMGEGKLFASNLTPHETGIKSYSDEEIINAIRMMKKKDGSPIMGPMAMYQATWVNLKDEDARAIVAFLRSLPPVDNKVPKSTFVPKGPPPGAGGAPGDDGHGHGGGGGGHGGGGHGGGGGGGGTGGGE